MMCCRELINDFLMEYLDQGLPVATRADFESHLRVCPSCRAYLDTYRRTIEISKSVATAPEGPPPEELVQAILKLRPPKA